MSREGSVEQLNAPAVTSARRKFLARVEPYGGHVGAEGVFFFPVGEKFRIAVIKSDDIEPESLRAVAEGFRERWPEVKIAVMGIGERDSFDLYEEPSPGTPCPDPSAHDRNDGEDLSEMCGDCGADGLHHCPAADDWEDVAVMENMAGTP